jgi:16S rRNA (cytidine1402-2'-O)-methyltransferase
MTSSTLFVVATPIGNLGDITLRALDVLREADVIAAEDTRHTRRLLSRYEIDTPLFALHEHNEEQAAPRLVDKLLGGQTIALVSDAGTPLLSDPGYRLVRLAVDAGIRVSPIPGPSALTAALSISGLATDRFSFEGFLPSRRSARIGLLESLKNSQRTTVLFESSHRIMASLEDMEAVLGSGRQAAICREMTKQFETVLRGTLADLRQLVANDPDQRRGEFVIVLAAERNEQVEALIKAQELGAALQEYLSISQSARVAARICGVSRRELYALMEQGEAT